MSLNSFIPEIWADSLLAALRKTLVFGNLLNEDYEGEIKHMGDTVKINAIGDVSIYNYSKDTDLNPPQSLTDAQSILTVSQAKYYNFAIDDVDAAQSNPKVMGEAMAFAAYRVKDVMDQYYAGFYTDCVAANLIGSSGSFVTPNPATTSHIGDGTTVYDYVVQLSQKLDEALVPDDGRWCVVPPWVKTSLTQDPRFTSFNTPDARMTILTGKLDASGGNSSAAYLGKIENMDLYQSVNSPHLGGTVGIAGSQDVVIAGHMMAVTKAEGLNQIEGYRPPYRFSDAVKGMTLYGAKTVRPYALAVAYLQHP